MTAASEWSPAAVALALCAVGFAATALITRPLVGWLRRHQFGKAIRADGPDHAQKSGTPTMGGLALLGVVAAIGVLLWVTGRDGRLVVVVGGAAGFAALGLLDDLSGLARRNGAREAGVGLTARWAFVAQVLLASIAVAGLVKLGALPLLSTGGMGPAATVAAAAVAVLIVVGTVNGVNMSDGLDGLAAGLCVIAFAALAAALLAYRGGTMSPAPADLAWLSATIAGASAGFLVHNRHPAAVFMGNVTSMALGGALALIALAGGLWYVLPVIGAVFVAEVVSVITQVAYFKTTGGKRVFRMAPIHHHFELGGWPETLVVHRFWLAGLLAGMAGVVVARL